MKVVKAHSLEDDLTACIREFSYALEISESSFVEKALKHFIAKGLDKTIKAEHERKQQEVQGVIQAIKQGRNSYFKEVGSGYED